MLLLASAAFASSFVVSISEERALSVGGGWARAFDDDGSAWHFVWSAGGDYQLLPMTPELTVTDVGRTALTGHADLVDHAIRRCPDGSYLHAASANLDTFNDSAYAFRYAEDWSRTAAVAVEERVPERQHNDPAVLCSGRVDGVAFASDLTTDSVFFPVGADGTVGARVSLEGAASMMGGSLYYEADSDTVLALNFRMPSGFRVSRYTPEFELVETLDLDPLPNPYRGYWAQGILRVGDTYVVAHMARDEAEGWSSDEGDVWLTFFDTEWNALESVQLTQNVAPLGGMRPAIYRRGSTLVVTYDKSVQPRILTAELDLAALGAEDPEDSGWIAGDDTAGPPDDDVGTDGCGCATVDGRFGALGLLLGAMGVGWRRRT